MECIVQRNNGLYGVVILLGVARAVLLAVFALKLGAIVDVIGKDNASLARSIFACVLIIIGWFVASAAYQLVKAQYAYRIIREIKSQMYASMQSQPLRTFTQGSRENSLNLFTKNIDLIHDNYLVPRCEVVTNICTAVIGVATIFYISWKLGLAFVGVSLVTIIFSQIPGAIMAKATTNFSQRSSSYLSVVTNHLSGFEQITLLGIFPHFFRKYTGADTEFEKSRRSFSATTWIADNFGMLVSLLAQLLCMGIGIFFVLRSDITLGLLIAAINLLNSVFNPIQDAVHNKNLMGTVGEIRKDVDAALAQPRVSGTVLSEPVTAVEFDDVRLAFAPRPTSVLATGFTGTFERGHWYAIRGQSGSGKSALMKTLLGYYDPATVSGRVTINGHDLMSLSPDSIPAKIAYIQRNDFFIPGTVEEDIDLYRSSGSHPDLYRALGFESEFLTHELSNGSYQYVSLGEKQRIDIARFLIDDHDVLIFDEPTSNLDHQTSALIFDLIHSIQDKIVIVITHQGDDEFLTRFDHVIDVAH